MKAVFTLFLSTLFLCFSAEMKAQDRQRYRVHGSVTDARTEKAIKKIPILVQPFNQTIKTDAEGKFLLNMAEGSYSILIDYFPFDLQEISFELQSDTVFDIRLHSPFEMQYIDEIEIVASKPMTENSSGIQRLSKSSLNTMPRMIGEADLLKSLSLTAGVNSSNEGAADLQVRGGTHGQNLFLLDGVPLYSTQHMFGMVSAYNPSIVKTATLYKSDFPAEFGGKTSSVLNVESKAADLKRISGEAEIGLLSTKGLLNIPIVKDKLALSVAGRISNYSLLNIISRFPFVEDTNFALHFGDINANLFWKYSEKDQFKINFFHNSDGINVRQIDRYSKEDIDLWIKNRQQNLGFNWYHTFSENTKNHLLFFADRYNFDFGNSVEYTTYNEKRYFNNQSQIASFGIEDKVSFSLGDKINLKTGLFLKNHIFSPLMLRYSDESSTKELEKTSKTKQFEAGLFLQSAYEPIKNQTLNAGFRLSAIGNSDKAFAFLEPRLGYHGIFDNYFSLSASVGRMTQTIHRAANSGLGIPYELFFPSTKELLPEKSWNFSLGFGKDFRWNAHNFSFKTDFWYKTFANIVDFKNGHDAYSSLIISQNIQDMSEIITQGKGRAYGLDFSANYSYKLLSFSADYTLMQARNQFDELNAGKEFAAPTDIRNSLNLLAEINLSSKWKFSASWEFRTGRPITLPSVIYLKPEIDFEDGIVLFPGENSSDYIRVEGERNSFRTKAFHKLDLNFSYQYKAFGKYGGLLTFGLYNTYNRANPYMYFVGSEMIGSWPNKKYYPALKSLSIFPIIPSFSWSVSF